MKQLSDAVRSLIGQLHVRPSLLQRLTNASVIHLPVLADIAKAREPAAILHLIPFVFHSSSSVASAASDAIYQLFLVARDEDLFGLDDQIRDWRYWSADGRWGGLQPHEVAKVLATGVSRTCILGFITCHRNGRVRQEAVEVLGKSGNREAVPFLLLRANDWVPQVRTAAQNIIRQWLAEGPFNAFVPHLYLVFRLVECQRADCSDIIHAVASHFVKPEYECHLREVMKHGNRMVARRLFSTMQESEEGRTEQLVSAGLDSDDVILRYQAAQAVPLTFQGKELAAVLARLRTDVFASVRSVGLQMSISLFAESAIETLEEALLDRSVSVREQAAFQLRKIGDYDVASFFRKTLLAGRRITTAILGLGETGNESDVSMIRPFLQSPVAAERKAAVAALARVAGDDCRRDFLACLKDDSPKVVRIAEKWLCRRVYLLDLDEIVALFQVDRRLHVRFAVLGILHECDVWKGLPHLIRAAADDDQIVGVQSQKYIKRRYNRVFTKPSVEQQSEIQNTLRACASHLKQPFLSDFVQWLHSLGVSVSLSLAE